MKRYSICKEIQKLVRRLLHEGWTYEQGRRHGRIQLKHSSGFVAVPGTPSDRRSFVNFAKAVHRLQAGGVP